MLEVPLSMTVKHSSGPSVVAHGHHIMRRLSWKILLNVFPISSGSFWKMFPRLADGMPPIRTTPLEDAIGDAELEKRAKGTVAAAALRMHGKRLVVTESKLVGFAPMAARAGDKIMVLFGCNCPVVLHQMEPKVKVLQVDDKFYKGQCMSWALIGEVYVDGMMYGAAMQKLDAGQYTEESYYIH